MKGKQITQRKCSKMFCFTVPDFSPKFSLPQNGWFLCILRIFTQYRAPEYLDLSTQARVQVELNLRRAPSLFLLALWSARIWEGFFGLFHACLYIYIYIYGGGCAFCTIIHMPLKWCTALCPLTPLTDRDLLLVASTRCSLHTFILVTQYTLIYSHTHYFPICYLCLSHSCLPVCHTLYDLLKQSPWLESSFKHTVKLAKKPLCSGISPKYPPVIFSCSYVLLDLPFQSLQSLPRQVFMTLFSVHIHTDHKVRQILVWSYIKVPQSHHNSL